MVNKGTIKPYVKCIGASATEVTGSAYFVRYKKYCLLLDCGLVQGHDIATDYKLNIDLLKKIKPKEIDAQILLANLYTNFNHLDKAMDLYKESLRIKPNSAQTYMLLGNAHYLNGEIEQAIASYRASINIAPENDEYRLVYTQVLDEYIDKKRSGEQV